MKMEFFAKMMTKAFLKKQSLYADITYKKTPPHTLTRTHTHTQLCRMNLKESPLPFAVWALWAVCQRMLSFAACNTNIRTADFRCLSKRPSSFSAFWFWHSDPSIRLFPDMCETSVCDITKLKIGFEQISHLLCLVLSHLRHSWLSFLRYFSAFF